MKWITAFFLILCSFIKADLTRTIDSITYRSQTGNTVALIKLSDDSVWKWMPDEYSENLLRKWTPGEEIIITVNNKPGFTLQNETHTRFKPNVSLNFNSYTLYPQIKSISEEDMIIELTDGSMWELLYDFDRPSLIAWAENDRIIPVLGSNNNFELINIDIPHEVRHGWKRSLQAEMLIEAEQEEHTNPVDD